MKTVNFEFIRYHFRNSKHFIFLNSSSIRRVMIENTSQISILGTIYFSLTCFSLIMPSLHPGALGNHPIQIPPDFPPILKAYTKVRSCMYNPSMYDHKTTPEPESN